MTNDGAYVPPLEGRRGKLRLDFNENTVGCSPAVIEMLASLTGEDLATYPEYGVLRRMLAGSLEVPLPRLITTNGADEAIRLISYTALRKGGKVIIPDPSFAMWRVNAEQLEAEIVDVPYGNDLSFPTEGVSNALDKDTKLVVIVSPNNPTGTSITRKDMLSILEKAGDALVAVDEAYYEFSGMTFLDLVDDYPNLLIIRTFSKAYGLAGLRLGYMVAQEPLATKLDSMNSPYGVNSLAVKAAQVSLRDRGYVERYSFQVKKNRTYLKQGLTNLGIETYPSDANFVLARLDDRKDFIIEQLGQRGILVRDMGRYPLISDCMRITIGTKEQMERLLGEFTDIMGGMENE